MGRAAQHSTSVAIVGLGSRGLSVLERVVTLAKRAGPAAGEVRVEVIDPTCGGAGVHAPALPDYLLLNTTCSQVSMFPDACTVGEDVDAPGPNLYEWVTGRGLLLDADGCTVGTSGRPIRPTDFLPRRVLGEYLGWFLGQVLVRAPDHVQVVLHRDEAVDIVAAGDGFAVLLAGGARVPVRYAFLTTGYTPNAYPGHGRRIAVPYPLPERLVEVAPGQTLAIAGFGLSAMDILSSLTVGRGGRFVTGPAGLEYLPSGREPVVVMYSRSGVPCRARPLVARFDGRHEPLALTTAQIDALRTARNGPLDFDADVLPLVLTEMRLAYRWCEARCAGLDAERELRQRLGAASGLDRVRGLLDELDERLGPFDARAAFDGTIGMRLDDSAAYQSWFTDAIRGDLAEGVLGLSRSPVKAALDILRQLRDTIRYVVDFGGLTDRSLDDFNWRTVPLMNRAVVGPQYERHAELLTLMAAGIVSVPFGPAPDVGYDLEARRWTISSTGLRVTHSREADWVVSAIAAPPAVESSASPLVRALHRKGWLRPYRPANPYVLGVDVDRDLHPLDASGRPDPRLWVLGMLCEGATFYNSLVPSPNVHSRPIFDAHRCVAAMLANDRARLAEAGAAR